MEKKINHSEGLAAFQKRGVALLAHKFLTDYERIYALRIGEELEHYWETWARSTIRETELRRSVWMAVMQIKLKRGQHRSNG